MWRIATALGYPHPRLMVQGLSSPEVTELIAFYESEPFGEWRADLRMGISAREMWRTVLRRGARAPVPGDFMPFEKQPEDPKTLGTRIVDFFKGLKSGAKQ